VIFERVLKGGEVVDGTGSPPFRADVAIAHGLIAAVGQGLQGADVIDCGGVVVAPGFIDCHSHSDLRVFVEPLLPMKVRQGIALEVLGQDGMSVAPVQMQERASWRRTLAGLLGDPDLAWDWSTVADFMARLAEAKPAPDVAYLAPHGALRQFVAGGDARRLSADELVTMQALLGSCLDAGACGLSVGLAYAPSVHATVEELVALGRVLRGRGRPLVAHIRNEGDRLEAALDEMVDVAERSGCAVHISHLKIAGRRNWSRLDDIVARLEAARSRGVRVTADQYPYTAASTWLQAILPPWAKEGGTERVVARLRERAVRERVRQELHGAGPFEWDNHWSWTGAEGILLADVPSGRHREWLGRSLADIASTSGQDPLDLALDLLVSEALQPAMIAFTQDEAVIERLLALPWVSVGTDGLLGGRPHPRAYGTFPRVLGRYVRDRGALTLEAAIQKMTSQAASAFGLVDVGLVRPGLRANLTVLDPRTVADTADYAEPVRFPEGIPHVLVAGEPVVRGGEMTGARPGATIS
jgi:N-acyl-D-amino-acid deacylase